MENYDPHKNTTEMRQGNKRGMNLRVLLISMGLIVIGFAVIYLIYTAMQPNVV